MSKFKARDTQGLRRLSNVGSRYFGVSPQKRERESLRSFEQNYIFHRKRDLDSRNVLQRPLLDVESTS